MAEITAALVKELREVSGAGMMDCKKALAENGGNLEEAVDWLRKKGLAAAAKKAGRVAAEGLVAVVPADKTAVLVEVNSETDFVARNDKFQDFVSAVAKQALNVADLEALKNAKLPDGQTVAEKLTQLVATIGENMNLRRMAKLEVKDGVVATYMHNTIAPNMGKIGVLVALESTGDKGKLAAIGKQIAMHVAHSNPQALDIASVDPASVERERAILTEQAQGSGKPAEVIAKMVEGRLRKFYEQEVLLEQTFVIDNENQVKKVVENAAKEVGAPVKLTGFVRFALGEGIAKEQADAA
ncbi:MAG TPA: translation elongation factor Ts [Dongiaceae bacterium]|jgi:elongation factor Ts|nr:translation elongation factor Ts [Dongiaceae bacterium]